MFVKLMTYFILIEILTAKSISINHENYKRSAQDTKSLSVPVMGESPTTSASQQKISNQFDSVPENLSSDEAETRSIFSYISSRRIGKHGNYRRKPTK